MRNLLIIFILILAPLFADAQTVLFPNRGGTGTTTIPTLGQILMGQANGTYAPVATSSLGITGGGGGTPGGSDTELQFNDAGAFGGARINYTESGNNSTLTHTGSGRIAISPADAGEVAFISTGSSQYAYWSVTGTAITGRTYTGLYNFDNSADSGINGILDFSDITSASKTYTFQDKSGHVALIESNTTLESVGDNDLILQTGNSTTGNITITDGANGAITLAPNGGGDVIIDSSEFGLTGTTLPYMYTYYNDSTPANGDRLFELDFYGNNAGGSNDEMGAIISRMNSTSSPIATSLEFKTYYNDIYDDMLQIGEENGLALNGIAVGNPFAAGVVSSNDNNDLVLQTGNTTTGSITIVDGTNGDIIAAPNGSGGTFSVRGVGVTSEEVYAYSGTGYAGLGAQNAAGSFVDAYAEDNNTYFSLTDDGDGAFGPFFQFKHDSASPAIGDMINRTYYQGEDSGGGTTNYASQEVVLDDPTAASEDGAIVWSTFIGGADTEAMALRGGNLGVGTTSPDARLSLQHSGTGELATYREYEDGSGAIDFGYYKLSASPAFFDNIVYDAYYAYNDAFELIEYAYVDYGISDETAGTEDGNIDFGVESAGSGIYNRLSLDGNGFDINSNGVSSDVLIWSGTSEIALIYDDSANNFSFCTDDACEVIIGNVLQIPNGTAPVADSPGEIAHDTTGNQFIVDDYVVPLADQRIWGTTIASTSPAFISGGLLPAPNFLDGYTITRIQCYVVGGTSKVIAIEDASANSSEDITCATTNTTDDGSITNATYTANELQNIDFGATTGSVNYVSISVFGNWTRE